MEMQSILSMDQVFKIIGLNMKKTELKELIKEELGLFNLKKAKERFDELNEVTYRNYKYDKTASPKQKVNASVSQINSQLIKIERINVIWTTYKPTTI